MSHIGSKAAAYGPGIIAGIYAGRVISELWARWNGSTALWLGVAITLLCTAAFSWLFSRFAFRKTWPLLLLGIYVVYPEPNLQAAGLVAIFAFLTWWQTGDRWSSMPKSIATIVTPTLLLLICFALYVRTLAPDILSADNGEFQLVAANLGVAHPPGFPLYTVLAHAMTRLPVGPTPAYRVNLFSAITSTVTLAAVYTAVYILTRRALAAVAAVLALATATTFWAQATTANIRSMTALFTAVIFLLLVLFYRRVQAADSSEGTAGADRALILIALAMGLGVTHHASLAFLGLIAIVFVLLVDSNLLRSPRRWWRAAFAFVVGLLPLLYLPLRANADVRGSSPSLATLPGFMQHALALGFRGDLFVYLEPGLLLERLKIMLNVLTFQFSPLLVAIVIIALILLIREEWRLAFLFGGTALLFTFVTATYRAPQTVEYMLPAYVALALVLGTGAGGLADIGVNGRSGWWRALRYILTALVIVLAVSQLLTRYGSYSRLGNDTTARDYANNLLEDAPQDALLLANWHWATPLWYLQEVEGKRPDVEVRYVFPKEEPYAQTWARRVAEGLSSSRDVITTNFDRDAFATLPVPEPLAEAFLFRQQPRSEMPDDFIKLDLILGERLQILGYKLERRDLTLADEAALTLAWQPVENHAQGISLFAHLVGPDGRLAGQSDVPARARKAGITLTRFGLTPFSGSLPGTYEIQIGAYDQEPLPAADGSPRVAIETVELRPNTFAPATLNPVVRLVDGNRQVVGFDRDNTLAGRPRYYVHWRTDAGYFSEAFDNGLPPLPSYSGPWGILSNHWDKLLIDEKTHYVQLGQGIAWTGSDTLASSVETGQELVSYQSFQSSFPVMSDLVMSLRLIGFEEDGFHWAWWDLDDAIPAMGAIPTLKWIAGSEVTSPHFVTVSETAAAEQKIGTALTLYDAFTGRVLPLLDDRLAGEFGWIPTGETQAKR